MRESIHRIEDSLARALCWGALWDMTRDAELSAGDFVALVLQGLGRRVRRDRGQAAAGLRRRSPSTSSPHPAKRDALRATWEQGLRDLIEHAEPGQRPPARRSSSRSPAPPASASRRRRTAAPPAATRASTWSPPCSTAASSSRASTVAPDLRWALLTALARGGRADADRVAEELARDNTISGQERAAAALAVIPSAETKAQAWDDAALRDDISNETQRSIAYVFDGSDQADVLEPYLEKYLAVADTVWEDQGTQIASTMLEYMFPRALTSQATLDRVDAWLETSHGEPGGQAAGAARPGPTSPAPWPPRTPTPDPPDMTKGRTRGVRPFVVLRVLLAGQPCRPAGGGRARRAGARPG